MAVERKKATGAERRPSQSPGFSAFKTDVPIGPSHETIDPLVGLDVRAQSARLKEAFPIPDANGVETPQAVPLPKRASAVSQYGWRAAKSVLGLLIVVFAGVGPLQRHRGSP
jgi:hypothetical protein